MAEYPDPVMKILLNHLGPLVAPHGGSGYTFHAGLPNVLAGRIQFDLTAAGLFVPPGGQTRTEWASHEGLLFWGSGETALENARREVARGKGPLMSRTVYESPWTPTDGDTP